ncbi:hypothetical protein Tco_0686108 [Tanacetum coccineum]
MYSWGDNEDVGRKVIVISSCILEDIDSVTKIYLLDATDKCVSVDFVLLEKVSGVRGALSKSIDNFNRNICDLENCSFRNHLSDAKVLCALVREWLNDLRDEAEQLQARRLVKPNMLQSVCRCHGYPLDDERGNKLVKSTSCPVTGNELAALDLIRNSLKVGEHTVLLMPSFHYYIKLQHATSPIDFNIIERTNLWSLCEGLIMGTPIVVVPSTFNDLDDTDQAESLPAKSEELPPEPTSTQGDSLNESESSDSKQAMGMIGSEEEIPQLDFKSRRDKITERITEEWEQLIVNEIPKISHLNCVSKPKLDHLAFTPIESSKPLNEKTSRILESFGQALSTRLDILPSVYRTELAKLQDQIPPFSTKVAIRFIETQLGAPISQLFTDISRKETPDVTLFSHKIYCF